MTEAFDDLVMRTTTKRTREKAKHRSQELIQEMLLSEIRVSVGKSQREVAETLGIRQPSLSKLEKQTDMQIATLQRIIAALGGQLQIIASFPKGTITMPQYSAMKVPSSAKRKSGSTDYRLV